MFSVHAKVSIMGKSNSNVMKNVRQTRYGIKIVMYYLLQYTTVTHIDRPIWWNWVIREGHLKVKKKILTHFDIIKIQTIV